MLLSLSFEAYSTIFLSKNYSFALVKRPDPIRPLRIRLLFAAVYEKKRTSSSVNPMLYKNNKKQNEKPPLLPVKLITAKSDFSQ